MKIQLYVLAIIILLYDTVSLSTAIYRYPECHIQVSPPKYILHTFQQSLVRKVHLILSAPNTLLNTRTQPTPYIQQSTWPPLLALTPTCRLQPGYVLPTPRHLMCHLQSLYIAKSYISLPYLVSSTDPSLHENSLTLSSTYKLQTWTKAHILYEPRSLCLTYFILLK